MKTILTNLILLSLFLYTGHTYAQVSPSVASKYSADIVERIGQITAKVNLSMQKQMELGAYFQKQDDIAKLAIAKGASLAEAQRFLFLNQADLGKILSPLEMNDYSFTKANSASKFSTALKFRDELKLSKTQSDSLLNQLILQKELKTNPEFNNRKYEDDHLANILNKEQNTLLLSIINRDKAIANTNLAWQQLKKFDLTKHLDSVALTSQILNYESALLATQEKAKYIKDTKIMDSIRKITA